MSERKFSPFKSFEYEVFSIASECTFAKNLYLRPIERRIILEVNRFMFLNSKMIVTLLSDEYEESDIRKNIKVLKNNSYLRSGRFCAGENKSTASVFFLGWRGRRELKFLNNTISNRYSELDKLTAIQIKEILASNQLLISEGINDVEIRKPIYTGKIFQQRFRIAGYGTSDNNQFLFNSVRGNNLEDLDEKANRIVKTLKRNNSISQGGQITIIFVCEDCQHMLWVQSVVEKKFDKMKNITIKFRHDLEVNQTFLQTA